VQGRPFGIEPVRLGVLSGHHDGDVVPGTRAVVVRRQERVRVRRQVDRDDRGVWFNTTARDPGSWWVVPL
jgi:hypothetical protein